MPSLTDLPGLTDIDRNGQFKAIVDCSDDAIIGKDLDGIVQTSNPAAERMFGYCASEMIGQSVTRLLPAGQLKEEQRILGSISRALHQYGLSGHNLVVEITGHSLMDHSQVARRIQDAYQGLGIEIAIDDFGTGYCSLAYLKHYPVKLLKIDKSFVASLRDFGADYHLCDGILRIARNLGLKVVAEGVETEEQQQLLHNLGCDFYEGYLLSKPLNRAAFESFMTASSSATDLRS